MLFVCILSLFIGQALSSHSANQYVDTVINTALQNVIRDEKLEPTHLGDFTFDYKDKTIFGSINGKAEYTEGSLSGLSRVKRFSECEGPKNISSNTVINCTLIFQNLEASHKGKIKYGVLPKVTVQAKGNAESIYVRVGIAKSINERNAKIKTFTFTTTGSMTVTYTGLGPLNKQTKVLQENYKGVAGAQVMSAINNRFQYAFNLALAGVPMPLR